MKKVFNAIILSFFLVSPVFAQSLSTQLSGKILLQVERNGEAWYVSPATHERHFLYRPENAYQIMREESIGISNADLANIPIGFYQLSGDDSDNDGLIDNMEKAIGTNVAHADSDNDGFSDKEEVENGYNPLGAGKAAGTTFARNHAGKIFLQVESHGEAWWVNPDDAKRYYLGRAADAFALMRTFGLGISNANINAVPVANKEMDCIHDIECLISAFELDQPSSAEVRILTDFFGSLIDTTTFLELAKDNSTYILGQTTKRATVKISDEHRQELLDKNMTESEINAQEQTINQNLQQTIGLKTVCKFSSKENVIIYLNLAVEGNIATSSSLDSTSATTTLINPDDGSTLGECTPEN